MDVKLDRDVLRALSSDTRVEIIKLLSSRRHMQSELASVLRLSAPTVKEHLAVLQKAGLVERHDEGRKWKYYALTKTGRGVLEPEGTRLWLVLGTWLLSVVGTVAVYRKYLAELAQDAGSSLAMRSMGDAAPMMQSIAEESADVSMMMKGAPVPDAVPALPDYFWLFLTLAVVLGIVFLFLLVRRYKYRGMSGKHLSKK